MDIQQSIIFRVFLLAFRLVDLLLTSWAFYRRCVASTQWFAAHAQKLLRRRWGGRRTDCDDYGCNDDDNNAARIQQHPQYTPDATVRKTLIRRRLTVFNNRFFPHIRRFDDQAEPQHQHYIHHVCVLDEFWQVKLYFCTYMAWFLLNSPCRFNEAVMKLTYERQV